MKTNNHLKAIDGKTLGSIEKSLEELLGTISSHVIPLTPRERRVLPKMGEKTLAFVKKCYEFSQKNPELCPKYLDMDAFETDYKDATGLYVAINKAKQLQASLADIQTCAGSEAFQTALRFYNYVKTAAANDSVGAKVVYEELRKRFPPTRRRNTPEDKTQTSEVVI
jgi:hypothetical protein